MMYRLIQGDKSLTRSFIVDSQLWIALILSIFLETPHAVAYERRGGMEVASSRRCESAPGIAGCEKNALTCAEDDDGFTVR
jgi:hypothetical protein